MSDLSTLSLAELFRGIPDSLDRTKNALEEVLGPLKAVTEGFTDLKSAGELVIGAAKFLVEGLTESAKAFIEADASARRLSTALEASGTASLGAAKDLQQFNQALQDKLHKDADNLASLQATALGYGVHADNLQQATIQILALAEVTGSVESATRAVAQAHEGNFQKVSKLLGPVKDLGDLNDRLSVGHGLLAVNADTVQGKLEGLGAAAGDVQEAVGRLIVESETFQDLLDDLRTGADFTAKAINGLKDAYDQYADELEVLEALMNPLISLNKTMAEGAHEAFQALFATTKATADLTLTEAEAIPTLTAGVKALNERIEAHRRAAKEAEALAAAQRKANEDSLRDTGELIRGWEGEAEALDHLEAVKREARLLGFADEKAVNDASLQELEAYNAIRWQQIREELTNEQMLLQAAREDKAEARRAQIADDKAGAAATLQVQRDLAKDLREETRRTDAEFQKHSNTLAAGITGSIGNIQRAFIDLASSFKGRSVEENAKRLTYDVLQVIGEFSVFMGNAVIASGIAAAQLANPFTAIPAGAALVAIGTGILAAVGAAQAALSDDKGSPGNLDLTRKANTSQADNTGSGDGAVEGGLPQATGGAGRVFVLNIGQGAIVGGDGRAVGRDFLDMMANAYPTWRD